MVIYPDINPIAFSIGPMNVHWYGLMYLIGFMAAWLMGTWRSRSSGSVWNAQLVGDLIFYAVVGVLVGGRLGFMLFYNHAELLSDPLSLFRIWEGGMSFHGGLIGVLVSFAIFARNHHLTYFQVADFTAPLVPIGLATGRLGNFINGELWGRPTGHTWGMVFAHVDQLPRYPSQLIQMSLEGVLLFLILWYYSAKPKPRGSVSGLFLLGYGVFRMIAELFRQPDAPIGFVLWDNVTMGQLLSLPMVLAGVYLMVRAYQHKEIS